MSILNLLYTPQATHREELNFFRKVFRVIGAQRARETVGLEETQCSLQSESLCHDRGKLFITHRTWRVSKAVLKSGVQYFTLMKIQN